MRFVLNPNLDELQLLAAQTVSQLQDNEVAKLLAVAGSGKTTTIIESIKELINQNKLSFGNNVLVQFNKNIATETQEKIEKNNLDKFIESRTIHSIFFPALNTVKKFFSKLQVKLVENNFKATSIVNKYVDAYCENNNIDSEESIELFNLADMSRLFDLIRLFAITDYDDIEAINEVIERYSLNISAVALQLMQTIFNAQYPSTRYKDIEVFKTGAFKYSFYSRAEKKNIEVYEKNLNNNIEYMYFDFTDMLYIPFKYSLNLMNEIPSYEYIFIDEAQDLSKLDYCLIQLIKQNNSKLIYVGDHLQAINMFKGALPELYKNFMANYTCELNYNYRSGKDIIQYVNENTICKNIVSGLNTQGIINPNYLSNTENNKLMSFVNELNLFTQDKTNKDKHLILSEKNDILISLYIQLAKNNVSDITLKGVAELLTSYNTCINFQNEKMKVNAVKDNDSIDLVLNAIQLQLNMKRKSLQSLYNFDNENDYLKDTDYFNFSIIEYLVSELTSMKEYKNCKELSIHINKILNSYDSGKLSNKITLMTVHKSKGLESDIVTIVNSEFKPKEKLNKKTGKPYPIPNWLIEQFDNLKYVAFTRAVKQLNILTLPETEKKSTNNQVTSNKQNKRLYTSNENGKIVRNI